MEWYDSLTSASTLSEFLVARALSPVCTGLFGGKLAETMVTFPILSPVRTVQEDFLSVTFPDPRGNFYWPTSAQEEFPRHFL